MQEPVHPSSHAQIIERIRQEELEDMMSRPNPEGLSLVDLPLGTDQTAMEDSRNLKAHVCTHTLESTTSHFCEICAA